MKKPRKNFKCNFNQWAKRIETREGNFLKIPVEDNFADLVKNIEKMA